MNSLSALIVVMPVILVPSIYILNLHRKLIIKPPFCRVSLILFGLLVFVGVGFAWIESFERYSLGILVAFVSPILHALLLRFAFAAFAHRFGREPIDVAFNWSLGLFKDRVFTMAFVLGSVFLSLAGVGYFHWGIAVN